MELWPIAVSYCLIPQSIEQEIIVSTSPELSSLPLLPPPIEQRSSPHRKDQGPQLCTPPCHCPSPTEAGPPDDDLERAPSALEIVQHRRQGGKAIASDALLGGAALGYPALAIAAAAARALRHGNAHVLPPPHSPHQVDEGVRVEPFLHGRWIGLGSVVGGRHASWWRFSLVFSLFWYKRGREQGCLVRIQILFTIFRFTRREQ
ncbi:hypothetical protein ABZP36_016742 [Zizania latifolia]